VSAVEFRGDLWRQKNRVTGLSCGVVCVILRLAVLVEHRLVSDRQTDRRTDTGPWLGLYRGCIASRGNKSACGVAHEIVAKCHSVLLRSIITPSVSLDSEIRCNITTYGIIRYQVQHRDLSRCEREPLTRRLVHCSWVSGGDTTDTVNHERRQTTHGILLRYIVNYSTKMCDNMLVLPELLLQKLSRETDQIIKRNHRILHFNWRIVIIRLLHRLTQRCRVAGM